MCGMLRGVKLFGKWYALGSGSQHETIAVLLNPDAEKCFWVFHRTDIAQSTSATWVKKST